MLSFIQFLFESPIHNEFGFILPTGKIALPRKGEETHAALAKRLGYNDDNHALKQGLVRFFNNPHDDGGFRSTSGHEAGYEFYSSPTARKNVENHVRKLRGVEHINMDIWPGEDKTAVGSHCFDSIGAARRHLLQ